MKINNLPIANDQRLTIFGGVNVIESDESSFSRS
jgi:3-deoxy-D-manno-octulosonic acid (KDO) 8-phosphate synthase